MSTQNSEVLRRTLDHLCYEMGMLRFTHAFLTRPWLQTIDVERVTSTSCSNSSSCTSGAVVVVDHDHRFAFLESFLVHARNLLAFFYPRAKEDSDTATAADFVVWARTREDMGKVENLALEFRRIHKLVAHVSFSREESKPDANHVLLRDTAEALWAEFRRAAMPAWGDFDAPHAAGVASPLLVD